MLDRSSDLLIDCIEDIRAGRRSLAECAAEHPRIARELADLAPLALAVSAGPGPELDAGSKARTRAQLMAAIAHNGHGSADKAALKALGIGGGPKLAGLLLGPLDGLRGLASAAVVAHPWLAAVSGAVGAVVASGAVVYAAQTAPPDSVLAPVHEAVSAVSQVVGAARATPTAVPTPSATATLAPSPRASFVPSRPPVPREVEPAERATGLARAEEEQQDHRQRDTEPGVGRGQSEGRREGAEAPGQRADVPAAAAAERRGENRAAPPAPAAGRPASASEPGSDHDGGHAAEPSLAALVSPNSGRDGGAVASSPGAPVTGSGHDGGSSGSSPSASASSSGRDGGGQASPSPSSGRSPSTAPSPSPSPTANPRSPSPSPLASSASGSSGHGGADGGGGSDGGSGGH